jgi:hypothetical protein
MLTKDQKVKKLEIQKLSYDIQTLISKTLEENINRNTPNFGETKREVRKNLAQYTQELNKSITEYSSSLFDATELANFETVISGSALYGS